MILCDVNDSDLQKKQTELISAFRQAYPATPIVAMFRGGTAGNDELDGMVKDLGATAVIRKPFTISALLDCTAKLL